MVWPPFRASVGEEEVGGGLLQLPNLPHSDGGPEGLL